MARSASVGGDLYWWSARNNGSVLPLVPFMHLHLTGGLYLDGAFPFSAWIDGPDGKSRAGLGNPTLGVHYAATSDKLTWFVGGRLSLPLASINDQDFRFADVYGAVTMAMYDSYLWVPQYFPFSATGGVEFEVSDIIHLRASADPIFFIPTGKPRGFEVGGTGDFEFALQTKFEFEARAKMGVGGGVALQTVWFPTERGGTAVSSGDNAQLAMEPFFAYDNGRSFFMRFGLLMPLDTPLGFAFDRGKVLSPHLQLGGHLD